MFTRKPFPRNYSDVVDDDEFIWYEEWKSLLVILSSFS